MEIASAEEMNFGCAILAFFALVSGQFWPTLAEAAEELTLHKLMLTDYPFPSGFRWQFDCDSMLADKKTLLQRKLSESISEFKRLKLENQIKSVHAAADIIFRSGAAELENRPDSMEPLDDELVSQFSAAIGLRLKVLSEVRAKKLSPNLRELLVISQKLGLYYASIERFSPTFYLQVKQYSDTILAVKAGYPEEMVDHDLKAVAHATAAILAISRISQGTPPKAALGSAIDHIVLSLDEDEKGHVLLPSLGSGLMVLHQMIRNFQIMTTQIPLSDLDRYAVGLLRSLRRSFNVVIKSGANDSRAENALSQIESIWQLPGLDQLHQTRTEISLFRAQFDGNYPFRIPF